MSSKDYIYCYQGSALRVGSGNVVVGKVFDPYDPSTIPDHTIRCRFTPGFVPSDAPSYRPLTTKTLVVPDQNIWDITRESPDWGFLVMEIGREGLIEVLGAKSSGVTDMSATFRDCSLLESVQLFDTSSVTSMGGGEAYGMFKRCSSLRSVPLFDTSSCGNMGSMFYNCSSLTTVPLFDTSSCTNMRQMFYNCSSLTTVPLFDTSSCTNMEYMLRGCSSLTSVPFFDTSSCTTIKSMFNNCSSLSSLPLFDTHLVSNMDFVFVGCSSLRSIPLFDTSSCTTIRETFMDCTNVESGALAMYQQLSSKESVPAHSSCFENCGTNTTTGSAELAQIPADWK
jgi:surface protein